MREIIFRGKRILNGEWEFGDLWRHPYGKPDICIANPINGDGCMGGRTVDPDTVGQFTGLTDKNGKSIFEGDIVKCRHFWRLRVYPTGGIDEEAYFFSQKIRGAYGKSVDKENAFIPCERHYYFRNYAVEYFARNGEFRVRNGSCFHPLTRSWIFSHDLEVIGNIHDNPELLKGDGERREYDGKS